MGFAEIFILGMLIGGGVELFISFLHHILFQKPVKTHHSFSLMKKVSLFSLPVWGFIALVVNQSHAYATLFVSAALVGPLIELLFGKTVHRLFGIKLWTYQYGAIGRYTSIYAIPYWGGTALLFALLAKLAGL